MKYKKIRLKKISTENEGFYQFEGKHIRSSFKAVTLCKTYSKSISWYRYIEKKIFIDVGTGIESI